MMELIDSSLLKMRLHFKITPTKSTAKYVDSIIHSWNNDFPRWSK